MKSAFDLAITNPSAEDKRVIGRLWSSYLAGVAEVLKYLTDRRSRAFA